MRAPEVERAFALMKEAAIEAGEIAKRHFGRVRNVREKDGGQGPVTDADLEVNAFFVEVFKTNFPDWAVLSEEEEDDFSRLKTPYVFVVDPIDGTRAFVEGQPYFCHSIALLHHQTPVAAVVYLPVKDVLYSAIKGGGAFRNDVKIHPSSKRTLSEATILASKAKYNRVIWEDQTPPFHISFRPSIAYRLCLVADGDFDGTLSMRPSWDWDLAAGDLICREAGAEIFQLDGALPLYNKEIPQQNGILAGNKYIAEALVKLTAPHAQINKP